MIDVHPTQITRAPCVGHSSAADPRQAAVEAVEAALAGAPAREGDLVVLLASVRYDMEALHAAVAQCAAPAAVVGASTAGAFAGGAAVTRGCVVAYIPCDGLTFGVAHGHCRPEDPVGSARTVAQAARERAGERREHSALLLLADGMLGQGREFARGVYDATSALVPLVGAAAADDLRSVTTWTFGEGVARSHGIAAVWIDSDRPIGVGVGHGFRAVGCPHLVTRSDGPLVVELDGRPAMDVYLAELGGRLPASAVSTGGRVPAHPLGAVTISGHHDLYPVAPSGTALLGRSPIPEGTLVEVMCTDPQQLADGARRAALDAVAQLVAPPRIALTFGGVDRVALLGGSDEAQTAALVDGLGGAPLAGFHGFGQFARRIGPGGFRMTSITVLAL